MTPILTLAVDAAGLVHATIYDEGQRLVADNDQLMGVLGRAERLMMGYYPVRGSVERAFAAFPEGAAQ